MSTGRQSSLRNTCGKTTSPGICSIVLLRGYLLYNMLMVWSCMNSCWRHWLRHSEGVVADKWSCDSTYEAQRAILGQLHGHGNHVLWGFCSGLSRDLTRWPELDMEFCHSPVPAHHLFCSNSNQAVWD
eukprot:632031-Amphidinium_carterae.2